MKKEKIIPGIYLLSVIILLLFDNKILFYIALFGILISCTFMIKKFKNQKYEIYSLINRKRWKILYILPRKL